LPLTILFHPTTIVTIVTTHRHPYLPTTHPLLHSLPLHHHHQDDFHNARLPEFLARCRDLVTVELGGQGVGNDGAIAVAQALHGNGRVSTLNLCANGIALPGAKSLASLLGLATTVRLIKGEVEKGAGGMNEYE
jgi:hypothetical protein